MPESDNSQDYIDKSLSPLDIALHYTRGDQEKAQNMVGGHYKDLFAIKLKLSSPTLFGAFLLFFDHAHTALHDVYGIISKSYSVDEIPIDVDWQAFENHISEQIKQEEHDPVLLFNITKKIKEEFQQHLSKEIQNLLLANDLATAATKVQAHTFEKKGILNPRATIMFERISSLDMELQSTSSIKIHADNKDEEESETEDTGDEYEFVPLDDEDIKLYMEKKDIKLVLDGELMLSPISGMHITGLVSGDKVRVKITDKKQVAFEIARAFNAYQNGVMLPITGRIISFRHKRSGGFKVYVEIADGIFLRIDESEENIKIDFVEPSPDRPEEVQENIASYVNKYVEEKKQPRFTGSKDLNPDPDQERKSIVVFALIIVIVIVVLLLLSRMF